MIDINKYRNKKVYLQLESKIDDNDPEEEDKVEGGSIYRSLDEVMDVASEGDEYIEIEISKQFKTVDKCMAILEFKDGKLIRKA